MTIEEIKQLILEKFPGVYPGDNINIILNDVEKMDSDLRLKFENYLNTGVIPDIQVQDYSFEKLTKNYGMNAIATFLTLNWIIREPQKALASLKKGYDTVTFLK